MGKSVQFDIRLGNCRLQFTTSRIERDINVMDGRDIFIFVPIEPAPLMLSDNSLIIEVPFNSSESAALQQVMDDIRRKLKGELP